jgi:aminoglycoside/choline kinase family phosphotransferase
MDPRLIAALDRWACANPRPLAGDAGMRQYFRVDHPQLGSALVVLHPTDTLENPDDTYFEFRALQAYLDPVLRVPTILQAHDEDRCLLVEDLGGVSLEDRLTSHPEEERAWAAKVGWIMATWLGPLTLGAPPRSFFMSRSFDLPKFEFEWGFCRDHFFQEFLQKDPPRWLDRLMEDLHPSQAGRANFLAHRDFHVRNLMVQGDRLVVIDFQDARRGAATYDLASVLFDGYWDWSPEASRLLVGAVRQELGWSDPDLWEELNLSAVQRNLKALGTFGFQLLHRGKPRFAPAIPRTLRHLRGHFQRMHHGEGVLAAENWLRLAEKRLFKLPGDEAADMPG